MTQAKTAKCAETSLRLVDEAERHLEADDLYKACEKGLEAVNHYLRMVGEQRGWARESKRDLCDIATDLAYETDDAQEAMTLYGAAEGGFAIKFYGSHHRSWLVEGGLDDARKWISLMESRYRPQRKVRLSQMDRERERQWNMEQKERMAKSGNRFADVGKRRSLLDRYDDKHHSGL